MILPARTAITDEWLSAAARGEARRFSVESAWGTLEGVLAEPERRQGWLSGRPAPGAARHVAFVVPQWPGLDGSESRPAADDALCAGLLRGGVSVARVSSLHFRQRPDAAAWLDAIADGFVAATAEAGRAGLAGTGFAGTAAALLSSRIPTLAFLVCAGAPSAEVLSRRTPEDEDDPRWDTDARLRLADALAAMSPLEAVTVNPRPVLFLQGSIGEPIGAEHLEAWLAALAATGRPADAVEIAFTDSWFGAPAPGYSPGGDERSLALLAESVGSWVAQALSRSAARRVR